jgi:hypothetical protein
LRDRRASEGIDLLNSPFFWVTGAVARLATEARVTARDRALLISRRRRVQHARCLPRPVAEIISTVTVRADQQARLQVPSSRPPLIARSRT